jgi:natural product precursor
MEKKKLNKLVLKKEAVASLDSSDLSLIIGGGYTADIISLITSFNKPAGVACATLQMAEYVGVVDLDQELKNVMYKIYETPNNLEHSLRNWIEEIFRRAYSY